MATTTVTATTTTTTQSESLRRTDFHYSDDFEPHVIRRGEILKAHPEITKLMGFEWKTKYLVTATVALQLGMAWLTKDWNWPAFLVATYVVGATATHSLFLAIHELAHNLGAKTIFQNKIISMIANLPIAVPYCITFKPYHMEHHRYQGQDGMDTDVPTRWEAYFITDTAMGYWDHTARKAIFMFFQILGYALRPMAIKPDVVPLDGWLLANWVVVFSFDAVVYAIMGPSALLYFLVSLFFAGSIHPTAGHFIAEHYVTEGKTETYSYYGPLNRLTYNVGYHNEHHDFPNIAWSNLPKVREVAPEFYNDLPQCKSWVGLLVQYIFDDSLSPYSRVKRMPKRA